MDDLEEEEDVIIEGSELHGALVSMGYTDLEFTLVNKNNFSLEKSSAKKYKYFGILCNFFKIWNPIKSMLDYSPKTCYVSSKQLSTILRAESLLDDHAALVHALMKKNSQTFWNKCVACSNFLLSAAMLGIGYSMFKRKKTFAMFLATAIAAFGASREYKDFQAIGALRDLVAMQNELYHSYRKSFGILRNVHRLGINGKKLHAKFSKLETDGLKYLQPIMETLLKSMENVSRTYYRASAMIVDLLPKNTLENDALTNFETDAFTIEGEITYENLRHLYYVYILVQSDYMQLLAIAYNPDTRMDNRRILNSLLTRIIVNLECSLTKEKNRLMRIIVEYETRKRRTIERKVRVTSASKWRDLYLNLDLMSRKLQITYDAIDSIIEDIEKRGEDETSEDTFMDGLDARIREIYSQIEKSKNFAEFNNLLIAILRRSGKIVENPITEVDPTIMKIEADDTIVRDSEPRIYDEVFEEYITEEYLKPLYEETRDEASMDIAKFDELLAKNFMSELKEALVEKYRSMSEREAKALLRKYRETTKKTNFEEGRTREIDSKENLEKSIIPIPPPLPGFVETTKESPVIFAQRRKIGSRGPVALPRERNFEDISHPQVAQRANVFLPPPSSLLSPKIEDLEDTERFSIDLPKIGARKMPAFVTFAEEFIGSGENSEDELVKSDNDDDES